MIVDQTACTVPEWLTAILDLEAVVKRPEAQKVGRWQIVGGAVGRPSFDRD